MYSSYTLAAGLTIQPGLVCMGQVYPSRNISRVLCSDKFLFRLNFSLVRVSQDGFTRLCLGSH